MKRKSSTAISKIFGIGIAVVLCGLGYSVCPRPLTAEEVATSFRDCVLRADAPCVRRLSLSMEIEANKWTDKELEAAIREILVPRFAGRISSQEHSAERQHPTGDVWHSFSWVVDTSAGPRPISVTVASTDEGVKVIGGLTALLLAYHAYDSQGRLARGSEKAELWATNFENDREALRKVGWNYICAGKEGAPVIIQLDTQGAILIAQPVKSSSVATDLRLAATGSKK